LHLFSIQVLEKSGRGKSGSRGSLRTNDACPVLREAGKTPSSK